MEFLTEERRRAIGWDEPFEDRWWRVEKIAWMLMTALLVAGGCGLFGRGALAKSHATGSDVAVEYERVVRYQTPTRISLRVPPDDRGTRVFVGRSLLDRLQVQSSMPPPLGSEVRPDGAVLLFPTQPTGGVITLTAEPGSIGICQQSLGLDGRPPISFRQLILP
jgi:protein-L-isoaspartate(D-aspartate) O-methyltransferase